MLQAKNLSYTLNKKALIQNISLDFSPGILYGILGPNGSGKSTFLKTLTAIWEPSSGDVLWNGENLHAKERHEISKIVSLVPQTTQMPFAFSVKEVVAMGRYAHGHSAKNESLVEWALSTVNAWHLRHRQITELSSGERQRIYIARALVTESPILLLDEPTTSLDIRHQLDIWYLMQKLLSHDRVIITTTHDLTAAKKFCDQITVLHQGQCIMTGNTQDVINPNLVQEVFGVSDLDSLV